MTNLINQNMITKSKNIKWHQSKVTHKERVKNKGHQPAVLWYTGISGSGKSTIANAVDKMLHDLGYQTYLLDGDNIRHGLNSDLSFDDNDRVENIRRVGEVAKLFTDAGLIVSTAFISPFKTCRDKVRQLCSDYVFIEIFVDTPLELCQKRDPKGLYKKASEGKIEHFTSIDSHYEAPTSAEIHLETKLHSIEECTKQVLSYLQQETIID